MVPFIIEDLRKDFNFWSHALYVLTGHEPSAEEQIDSEKLRKFWLRWADANIDFIDEQYKAMDNNRAWTSR